MNYNNLSSDWIEKFKNYNLDKYKSDIEKFGIQKTWDNICNFTLNYDSCCEFFNVSMFGELYELALAMIHKNQKKENVNIILLVMLRVFWLVGLKHLMLTICAMSRVVRVNLS